METTTMEFLEYQRRQQVEKREPNEAGAALKVLIGLGWNSQNFADVAAGLKKQEQANSGQPLRKIITPKSNQG
jgi:hypothetical protein